MPFKRTGPNSYVSPSGNHFNSAQVRLFYANGGKFPGEKATKEKTDGRSQVREGGVAPQSGRSSGRPRS